MRPDLQLRSWYQSSSFVYYPFHLLIILGSAARGEKDVGAEKAEGVLVLEFLRLENLDALLCFYMLFQWCQWDLVVRSFMNGNLLRQHLHTFQ